MALPGKVCFALVARNCSVASCIVGDDSLGILAWVFISVFDFIEKPLPNAPAFETAELSEEPETSFLVLDMVRVEEL